MTQETDRRETGVMRFDGDWPGVFIRGDDALSFAASLRTVLPTSGDFTEAELRAWGRIQELSNLLESCRATPEEQRR